MTVSLTQKPNTAEPVWEGVQYTPRIDICENDEEMVLFCDVPGVKPDGIQLRFEKNELLLHAKVAPRKAHAYWLNEYGMGDFHRTFAITTDIDSEKIRADYKLGVLIVHLPKKESIKPRQIAIKAG